MTKYVATRMIGYPLGSSNWAFAEGDEVSEEMVAERGYDNPADPYVELVDAPADPEAPASESQAETDKPAE